MAEQRTFATIHDGHEHEIHGCDRHEGCVILVPVNVPKHFTIYIHHFRVADLYRQKDFEPVRICELPDPTHCNGEHCNCPLVVIKR